MADADLENQSYCERNDSASLAGTKANAGAIMAQFSFVSPTM